MKTIAVVLVGFCLLANPGQPVASVTAKWPLLTWALDQPSVPSDEENVRFFPLGFSTQGRFATVKKVVGYRGECDFEECPKGHSLAIYNLNNDQLLETVWLEPLIIGTEYPSDVTAEETRRSAERCLKRHQIVPKSFRHPNDGGKGGFSEKGATYRIVQKEMGPGDYATLLVKDRVGQKVVTRYGVEPMIMGERFAGFVIATNAPRIALFYQTYRVHEARRIDDGRVAGAHLETRFTKSKSR